MLFRRFGRRAVVPEIGVRVREGKGEKGGSDTGFGGLAVLDGQHEIERSHRNFCSFGPNGLLALAPL